MRAITVKTTINQPVDKVWELWTNPDHIVNWNFASPDWCCPTATNDLTPNGKLSWRMEAKNGSMGFDFGGTYNKVATHSLLSYTLDDGRNVQVTFSKSGNGTELIETFDPDENDLELQKQGWQAILNNFKAYAENQK